MRIAVIAFGSRGDVEPYLALAKGLKNAGHVVRLVAHENFGTFIKAHGVEFWPVEGNAQDVAQSAAMRELLEKGRFLAILKQMGAEAQNNALAFGRDGLQACDGMELIVAGIGGMFIGVALAEKLNIQFMQAHYVPFTPTRAYPSALFPKLPSFVKGPLNHVSYRLTQQMLWQGFRSADNIMRQQVLGVPKASFRGPYGSERFKQNPILYGYSAAVLPKPTDWNERMHVTGYWFLDPVAEWTPPADLLEFLEAGASPVFIGFGSMTTRHPTEMTQTILQALARTQQRAILLSGWGGLHPANLPETIYALDSIPFAWLFPRVAAVVHHGGSGTTSAGLRAGVPSIIVPFFGDQPFWGQRVADLGVGPQPILRKQLTADRLAQAIQSAVTDQAMRQRAAELGAQIRAEDGIACAVEIINQLA
ncbi:vancomycin aglycone glucosyltransferase [Thermoflexales bacterium]|nr:vancomycin aglycone glucosyltransferase [Thermoflexales bacterium]